MLLLPVTARGAMLFIHILYTIPDKIDNISRGR